MAHKIEKAMNCQCDYSRLTQFIFTHLKTSLLKLTELVDGNKEKKKLILWINTGIRFCMYSSLPTPILQLQLPFFTTDSTDSHRLSHCR